jgi:4-hydroxybenzoate polyprenyltransferase
MAFAAQTGTLSPVAWLLFTGTVVWTVAYDTMYAMVDREDDLQVGVKSTAILFGDADRFVIGVLQVTVVMTLITLGRHLDMGAWYYLGVAVAAGLAIYQQKLISRREPAQCFRAFLNNNWFGAAVFAGIVLDLA